MKPHDANGWSRKTFTVRVHPKTRVKAIMNGVDYDGRVELIEHDAGRDASHWWISIDHAEYLIDQLQRAVKRAKK